MSALKLLLCLSLFLVTILPTPVFAEANCSQEGPIPVNAGSANCWKAESQAAYTMDNLVIGGLCQLGAPVPGIKCPVRVIKDNQMQLVLYDKVPGGGAIGSLTNVMVALYNPPTSSVEYLASVGRDLGIIAKPAYAQVGGSGSSIISPILQIWQVTRNLAYLVFIIVFIVIGFMIMFRQKMNQQAVVTAQAAIPGLIIGLVLVTFSYFISALIIDSAFIGTQLVAGIFTQDGITNAFGDKEGIQNMAKNSNAFELFTSIIRFNSNVSEVSGGINDTLESAGLGTPLRAIITTVAAGLVSLLLLGLGPIGIGIGAGVGLVGGLFTGPIIGLIVPLVLIIALIIQFFRLLFKLISAYLTLLISTVTAPFIILFASLPGRGGILSAWWKTLLGNALIFPAVFAAFLFAGLILDTKPEQWNVSPPLFGGLSAELLRLIIAYGIILGVPAVPDMVKEALGVKDIKGLPQAAMQGALSGFAVGRAGYGAATSRFTAEAEAYRKREAEKRARATGGAGKSWYGFFR